MNKRENKMDYDDLINDMVFYFNKYYLMSNLEASIFETRLRKLTQDFVNECENKED